MHTKFWSENVKGRDESEELGVDGELILELILGKLELYRLHMAPDRDR
jgi:hypothetical protein